MIHLRRRVLSLLVHPSPRRPAAHIYSLCRLLSSTTGAPVSPEPFSVQDYLVATCGLTNARAARASKSKALSRLNSPSNPDDVLAFLSGLGLTKAEIAAVVDKDPSFVCASVEKTLAPRIKQLADLGISRTQAARLILLIPAPFRMRSAVPNVGFWLPVFGSFDEILRVVRVNSSLLTVSVDKVARPNLALLQRRGISVSDFISAFMFRIFTRPTKNLEEALAQVDKFGIKQGSFQFLGALMLFSLFSCGKLTKKLAMFEKLGWTRDDVTLAVRITPNILGLTEERLQRSMKFLTEDVGLGKSYIKTRPVLLLCSIERRLMPRHCLINVLDAKGLLKTKCGFYFIATMSSKKFMNRFVCPYDISVPGLADAYASGCAGHGMLKLKLLLKNTKVERIC